jgi:hypothetical protein
VCIEITTGIGPDLAEKLFLFCTHSQQMTCDCHPNQDVFLHPLHINMKITEMLEFCKAGFLTVVNCQEHGGEPLEAENTMALNSQDGYPRKLVIACPDEKTAMSPALSASLK